jgi:hypothetical protein
MSAVLKTFLSHVFEDADGQQWMLLDTFINVILRKNRVTTDKDIKRSNMQKCFKGHKNGIKYITHSEDEKKEAINLLSLFTFIFSHRNDYRICQELSLAISNKVVKSELIPDGTLLQLYQVIAKNGFGDRYIRNLILTKLRIDETSIPSLYLCHKTDEFSADEWKWICLFEHQFSRFQKTVKHGCTEDGQSREPTLEEETDQKWTFYRQCCSTQYEDGQMLIKPTIANRITRKQSADLDNTFHINAFETHLPTVLEIQLQQRMNKFFPECVQTIVTVENPTTAETNKINIFIELSHTSVGDSELEAIINFVISHLKKTHKLLCECVVVSKPESLVKYKNGQHMLRFSLLDDFMIGMLNQDILLTWNNNEDAESEDEAGDHHPRCESCFSPNLPSPLALSTFDVFSEWFLDVPLPVQLFCESFINKQSLYHCPNEERETLAKAKIERLYQIYDALLNTFNKRHVGIFQQAHTEELMLNYHSISNIFSVTNSSGATLSLKTAEQKLKTKADSELCYYNTYIKRYPMTYTTVAGQVTRHVSLRNCYLTLMIDNLVRLRYVRDPNPGDNRSNQLCTLPIGFQGLPCDAVVTASWHDKQICDMTTECPCKEDQSLEGMSVQDLLIKPFEDEASVWDEFVAFSAFGHEDVWNHIGESELLDFLSDDDCDSDISDSDSSQEELEQMVTVTGPDPPDGDENYDAEDIDLDSMFDDIVSSCVLLGDVEEDLQEEDFCKPLQVPSTAPIESPEASLLDDSMQNLSLHDNLTTNETTTASTLEQFGFTKYVSGPFLWRHPPPATGRDDKIDVLEDVLSDILIKLGLTGKAHPKILFGPDQKIGINLLKLKQQKPQQFQAYLPEFPLLHLRKSKITILLTAYKDAGLREMLMYMKDEESDDIGKLLALHCIDEATREIRRLSIVFHTAFMLKFLQSLEEDDATNLLEQLKSTPIIAASQWSTKYNHFIRNGCSLSATFCLHHDIMVHCDEIVAIFLSERLGGEKGYKLLLAAVKSSLPFAFLNGATSYAPFCTQLILQHYKTGPFYRSMKHTLYSTPFRESNVNFSGDTKREMDHQEALKGFRSGSTLNAVLWKMSLVDNTAETHQLLHGPSKTSKQDDHLDMGTTEVDRKHIIRAVRLIQNRGGLEIKSDPVPKNVYKKDPLVLPLAILDHHCKEVGAYLIQRFVNKSHLLPTNTPLPQDVGGPKELVDRARKGKGTTMRRLTRKPQPLQKSKRVQDEEVRQKAVKAKGRQTDMMSSKFNAVQAILKPDGTKPKVQKARTMKLALSKLLTECLQAKNKGDVCIEQFMLLNATSYPHDLRRTAAVVILEFAGVKFKLNPKSGDDYIELVQNIILRPLVKQMQYLHHMVISEEKYSFTPDILKFATRQQRSQEDSSITHLKSGEEVINPSTFDKKAITTSSQGKSSISTYLAKHVNGLRLYQDMTVVIDSELHLDTQCTCKSTLQCKCQPSHAIPVSAEFTRQGHVTSTELLLDIHQKKGEAEMAQLDWVLHLQPMLKSSRESVVSVVTSGDIDAVVIHLYVLTWSNCQNPVYVVLQKPGQLMDIYNMTAILKLLCEMYNDPLIGAKIAITLCIGGNDFIPKLFRCSHGKYLKLMLEDRFRNSLFVPDGNGRLHICPQIFVEYIKALYSGKRKNSSLATYEEVRSASMKATQKKGDLFQDMFGVLVRDLRLWLIPESAAIRLAALVNHQIDYLNAAGHHHLDVPDPLTSSCFLVNPDGDVEYDFGTECHISSLHNIISSGLKRKGEDTPQKGDRRKQGNNRKITSTPKKN